MKCRRGEANECKILLLNQIIGTQLRRTPDPATLQVLLMLSYKVNLYLIVDTKKSIMSVVFGCGSWNLNKTKWLCLFVRLFLIIDSAHVFEIDQRGKGTETQC